jgi:hypothetical protein
MGDWLAEHRWPIALIVLISAPLPFCLAIGEAVALGYARDLASAAIALPLLLGVTACLILPIDRFGLRLAFACIYGVGMTVVLIYATLILACLIAGQCL